TPGSAISRRHLDHQPRGVEFAIRRETSRGHGLEDLVARWLGSPAPALAVARPFPAGWQSAATLRRGVRQVSLGNQPTARYIPSGVTDSPDESGQLACR